MAFVSCTTSKKFQSTPSVGRATYRQKNKHRGLIISIHALRGEGDNNKGARAQTSGISIHALRGEGDFKPDKVYDFIYISIHALRGEGDDSYK